VKFIRKAENACLLGGLLIALQFSSITVPLHAQAEPESGVQHSFAPVYEKTREITFNAVVQQVVLQPPAHSPVGLHLLVAGPQGPVDAHLGPYVAEDVRKALYAGETVQLVGVIDRIHGKDYLLARQLIFAGRLVTIRSERGFLVFPHSSRSVRPVADRTLQTDSNGGAR
jgi:hypothetical protein